MSVITIIIVIALVGLILWFVESYIPMAQTHQEDTGRCSSIYTLIMVAPGVWYTWAYR